jgi:biopolymer transport protein TolQ
MHLSSAFYGLKFGLDHLGMSGWLILGLIFLLSCYSLMLLVMKWLLLGRTDAANRRFMQQFHQSQHALTLYLTKEQTEMSPHYYLYHTACRELAYHLVGEEGQGSRFAQRLMTAGKIRPSQMQGVSLAVERAVGSSQLKLETQLGMVTTVLTVMPLLGIIGTLLGLLQTFSLPKGSALAADAAASGMSEALVTTLAAFVLMIPVLLGLQWIRQRMGEMLVRLDNFGSELCGLMERQFVDHQLPLASNTPVTQLRNGTATA